jgi:signal transduction histidine kinase
MKTVKSNPTLFSDLRRRDLRTLLHPQKALDRILAAAVRSTRADSGSFILVNPNSGLLDIEASVGLSERARRVKLRPGEGLTGWVATTGQPLRTGDVREEKRYVSINSRIRSEMAVPVEMRGQVVGLLNVDSTKVDAFSATDEARLVDMASEAAKWLELAWEIDQLRLKGRQLSSLVDTAQIIISETNLDEILNQITAQTYRVMKSKLCSIFLLSEDESELILRACHGGSDLYRDKPNLRTEDSLLGSVVSRHKPVAVVDVVKEKGYIQTDIARRERLVSMLAVPLIFAGKTIGVLAIYTQQRHRFSNDEIRILTTLGDLSAVAIEKGRLFARVVDMEEKLRASERLSALGLLAAEIAHEIRNPLTVLKLLQGGLGVDFPEGDPRKTDLRVMGEKLDQLESIVTRVLNFAKAPTSLHARCSVSEIVEDTLVLMRLKLAQSNIAVRFEPPARPLVVDGHKGQLQQVVLNLLINAMQAMPDGGEIAIGLSSETRGATSYAIIDMRDSGTGIPEAIRGRIFDSFLSGRPDGTGLGLAIVQRVLLGHHGDIALVDTGPGGTTFRLRLPLVK